MKFRFHVRLERIAVLLVATMLMVFCKGAMAINSDYAKKLETFPVYKSVLPWIACPVCSEMVGEAYDQVKQLRADAAAQEGLPPAEPTTRRDRALRDATLQRLLREEDILEKVVEVICNPLAKSGWWIRELDLVRELPENGPTKVRVDALPFLSKCRSDCNTISEACAAVLESDAAENLSGMLYQFKASKEKMQRDVCLSECKAFKRLNARWEKASATHTPVKKGDPLGPLPDSFAAEGSPIEVPEKELDIEEMMDRMERNKVAGSPKMEVLDRDTMLKMQRAMAMGDKEEVAKYEPSVEDLSDEEFNALQHMYKEEKGKELGLDGAETEDPSGASPVKSRRESQNPVDPEIGQHTNGDTASGAREDNVDMLRKILAGEEGDAETTALLESALREIDTMGDEGTPRTEDEKLSILLDMLSKGDNDDEL